MKMITEEITEVVTKVNPLIPQFAHPITVTNSIKQALQIAYDKDLPALLIGETGTGKTSLIRNLAYKLKRPYVAVNMTGFTTPDELIGSKSVKNNETYYENGIITNAMIQGAILGLDEINSTSQDCLFILHGLLDENKRITLPNGQVITPHPDFRVFATCNPDYEGTKTMNKAFLDRFPIKLTIDTLTPLQEKKLLINRTDIPEQTATNLVTIATMARKDYSENKITSYVSTRSLLNIAKLIKYGMDEKFAYETVIVNTTTDKDEQKALLDFYLAIMKLAEGSSNPDYPVIVSQSEIDRYKTLEATLSTSNTKLRNTTNTLSNKTKELETITTQKNNLQTKLDTTKKELDTYKHLNKLIKNIHK